MRTPHLVAAVAAALMLVGIVTPPPAAAECSIPDPWPQMREAAPSARRVVIGTVRDAEVERRRPTDRREVTGFMLEVSDDVKGSGPASIRLPAVATDTGCIGSRLWVREGDRIAVAFGGRAKGIAGPVSAVAFMGDEPGRVRGRPNHPMSMMEVVTAPQVRQLAQLPVGPLLYFVADDGRGPALWRSDGTTQGTGIVVRPGGAGPREPRGLVTDGRYLYFSAADRQHGRELWISDGSAAGTRLLRDIRPGPKGSDPDGLSAAWRDVAFAADDGTHGREPWSVSGWNGRVRMVRDVNRTPDRSASSDPIEIASLEGEVVASLDDGIHGREPWGYDARRVFDLLPGAAGSEPHAFVDGWYTWLVADAPGGTDVLYACEQDCGHPVRISSEGRLVAGVTALAAAVDYAYFVAADASGDPALGRAQLEWQDFRRGSPDGADAATTILPAPPPSADPPVEGPISGLTLRGDRLYLVVDDAASGTELWTSDGTPDGTAPVLDLADADLDPRDLVVVGPALWFSADPDDGTGREPWLSDGTAEGTRPLADIRPDGGSDPADFLGFRGQVVFTADDGRHGREVWLSDRTTSGTRLLLDIHPGPAGSEPFGFVVLGRTE